MKPYRLLPACLALALVAAFPSKRLVAQESKPAERQAATRSDKAERPPMPADVTVDQRASLPNRTLKYKVTAGSLPLRNARGEHKADIFYLAYMLDTGKPATDRPITFAFNGGPGAAAAYINLGALGPKHLAFGNQGESPSDPPKLADNPDTWLDFTDLVFIDPVGTGYSTTVSGSEEDNRAYWSVNGDIESLASFIMQYLTKAGRLASPHYLAGESYGGFRGPKLAHRLETAEGVGVSGIILLSPALDFTFVNGSEEALLPDMAKLPSMAATAMAAKGPVTPDMLKPVEQYAAGDYLLDLVRGKSDPAGADRIARRMAELTGLEAKEIKRLGGQIGIRTFVRALHRDQGEVASIYDGTTTGFDPFPHSADEKFEDPILQGTVAPITSAIVDYIQNQIGYKPDLPYHLLSYEVNGKWNWSVGHGEGGFPQLPSAVDDLRRALALDRNLKVLITHGMTDLTTPYFASRFILDHVPDFGDPSRVQLRVYPGGHMHYTRDGSRAALKEDARKLYP